MTESVKRKPLYVAAPRLELAVMFAEANGVDRRDLVRVTSISQVYHSSAGDIVWVLGEIDSGTAFCLHLCRHQRDMTIKYAETNEIVGLNRG